jgi:hypothetical protein
MKWCMIFLLSFLALFPGGSLDAEQPNILFVLADDLGLPEKNDVEIQLWKKGKQST